MTDRSLATSADYADALLVARRAKNLLFLLILLMLLGQIALFFTARYTSLIAVDAATTKPASRELLHYVSGIVLFLGTILPILLSMVLLLIVHIMLVGRLIGVARVTGAFLACLLLVLLMFPWQIFFGMTSSPTDFRVPGVLFTWHDLVSNAKFHGDMNVNVVKWARFFVMPVVAAVLLLMVQIKSNRGLRQALGEDAPEITTTT